MPKTQLTIPHKLGVDEAKQRILKISEDAKTQFSGKVAEIEQSWTDNSSNFKFRAMGMPVSGRLNVEAEAIRVEMEIPFAALPFKSRIEQEILTKAKTLFA